MTGLVVPPADPVALAGAINQILGDERFSDNMSRAARQRAEAEFTVERMVERVRDLYGRLL